MDIIRGMDYTHRLSNPPKDMDINSKFQRLFLNNDKRIDIPAGVEKRSPPSTEVCGDCCGIH